MLQQIRTEELKSSLPTQKLSKWNFWIKAELLADYYMENVQKKEHALSIFILYY